MIVRETSLQQRSYPTSREDTFFKTKKSNFSSSKISKTVTLDNPNAGRNLSSEKSWIASNPKNPTPEVNCRALTRFKKIIAIKQSVV
jgi:hypothetical protein